MTEQPTQDEKWIPLSAREDPERAAAFAVLHEEVTPLLAPLLENWIDQQISEKTTVLSPWGTGRRVIDDVWRMRIAAFLERPDFPITIAEIPIELYFDIIDFILRQGISANEHNKLADYLADGRSVWRVGAGGLERRVGAELQATADSMFASGSRAARYLRYAWQKAWSRNTDASGAYWDSVRAVEAAYKPIVSPNNKKTTLGIIISNVMDKPTKFRVRLQPGDNHDNGDDRDNVERIVAMLRLLWKSEFDRHGTDDETVPLNVSIEEAQDAVALAMILVHLAQQGGFAAAR